MQTDFGYNLIQTDRAMEILKTYEGKWIFVKFIVKYYDNDDTSGDEYVMYSKILVNSVQGYSDVVFLYGSQDNEQVIINKKGIIQCEEKVTEQGTDLKLVKRNGKMIIWVYLLENFISNTIRERNENLEDTIKGYAKNIVITEGKTDWKHLKRALKKLKENDDFISEDFKFYEYKELKMNNSELLELCRRISMVENEKKIIAIFDCDDEKILNAVTEKGSLFKAWGNNVYSFAIPVPRHRESTPNISIEHYYTDQEIKIEDNSGRRLYMGNEFSVKSCSNSSRDKFCSLKNKIGSKSIQIIDSDVYRYEDEETNIALTKNDFAENILYDKPPFNEIGYENFRDIFEIINKIIRGEKKNLSEFYMEQGKDLKINQMKIFLSEGDIVTLLVKANKEKVNKLKCSNLISTMIHYFKEINELGICVCPFGADERDSILGIIPKNDKVLMQTLIKISNGFGQLEFACISEECDIISSKTVLNNETGRLLLKRALRSSGII